VAVAVNAREGRLVGVPGFPLVAEKAGVMSGRVQRTTACAHRDEPGQLPRRAVVLLRGAPPKLRLIATGNISNDQVSRLRAANLNALEKAFKEHAFAELSVSAIAIHA
jgi:hypothetical protein